MQRHAVQSSRMIIFNIRRIYCQISVCVCVCVLLTWQPLVMSPGHPSIHSCQQLFLSLVLVWWRHTHLSVCLCVCVVLCVMCWLFDVIRRLTWWRRSSRVWLSWLHDCRVCPSRLNRRSVYTHTCILYVVGCSYVIMIWKEMKVSCCVSVFMKTLVFVNSGFWATGPEGNHRDPEDKEHRDTVPHSGSSGYPREHTQRFTEVLRFHPNMKILVSSQTSFLQPNSNEAFCCCCKIETITSASEH